jgi:uncharacterized protein YyaL (SSP411 family)
VIKKTIFILFVALMAFGCNQQKTPVHKIVESKPNDLINETSPYLLQHAYNPVNWKPWSESALQQAKEENKLIVISVGYSACHWCHVMEEESFENDSIAKIMNDNFISIKVDREERPDIDQVYMNAVQLMTGSSGWPLNCIALPDGRPVFGGTYFSKKQWAKILTDMSELYANDPQKVIAYAQKLTEGVQKSNLIEVKKGEVLFTDVKLNAIVTKLETSLDFKNGGLANAPKFPMPSNLEFLLRYSYQTNNNDIQSYVETTLLKMANGGIYDQIGGGFSRYSVDERWHVPHFEKMLYDNAQLVSLYSKAYQLTKNKNYSDVIQKTLSFVERELLQGEGAFYSSLDADSKNVNGEVEEGAFYVWDVAQLKSILEGDYDLFSSYYNINEICKWENDKYILYKTQTDVEFAKSNSIELTDLQSKVALWKAKLFKARALRNRPKTDDKVLTSWNALMLEAYVNAYKALGNEVYLKTAKNNANFIVNNQLQEDGSLFHSYKDGKSTISGFSEDYAHTISAFIALYQVTFDDKWLTLAKQLTDYTLEHFLDENTSMLYFTNKTSASLIARKMEVLDNVIPASNSVMADNLFKLSRYFYDKNYSNSAKQMLSNIQPDIEKAPSGYTNWMSLYLNYSNPYYEVAISGKEALEKMIELNNYYLPNILMSGDSENSDLPLLKNKFIEGETFIYVCVNGTCKLPVINADKAKSQILK